MGVVDNGMLPGKGGGYMVYSRVNNIIRTFNPFEQKGS